MVDFNNTEQAFILKSNRQLKKAKFLYSLVANPTLVKLGKKGSAFAMRVGLPIRGLIKSTVYDQFVGGETIAECKTVIENMRQHGVLSILDYSVEGKISETDFDSTCAKTIETIRFGKENKGVPFCVFKVTGLARFTLLEKVSKGTSLSSSETKEWEKAQARVKKICQEAYDHKIQVLIDAEETWIQPAIDQLAEDMMAKFNADKAVVFNTLQMYRTDRMKYLKALHQRLREKQLYGGLKLVRGAYMEKERERAKEQNYPSPIQPTKQASDENFDTGLRYVMDHIDAIALVAGSHNEESSRLLTELIEKKGVAKNDPRVWFSQLYGMSDHLSFNLASKGYNVVKYLPFGPVKETLPYLIRRAEENSSASGQTSRELTLIEQEIKRRGI